MTTYANLIINYLTKHPRRTILVSNMLDDLGIYHDNPTTKRRSYTLASATIRALVQGQENLKYKMAGIGEKPMEGLEVVHEVTSGRGSGGIAWPKCSLRYTPPVEKPQPVADPDPSTIPEVHVYPSADLSGIETGIETLRFVVARLLDEQKTTNEYLRRLVESWDPGTATDINKENL